MNVEAKTSAIVEYPLAEEMTVEQSLSEEMTVEQSLERTLLQAAIGHSVSSSVPTSETTNESGKILFDVFAPTANHNCPLFLLKCLVKLKQPKTPLPTADNDKYNGVFEFDQLLEPTGLVNLLLEMLQLDDKGIDDYLVNVNGLRAAESNADTIEVQVWLAKCAAEDTAGRRYSILNEAIARHLLYSYCDVLYVLNPHVKRVTKTSLVELAACITKNYAVDVELTQPKAKSSKRKAKVVPAQVVAAKAPKNKSVAGGLSVDLLPNASVVGTSEVGELTPVVRCETELQKNKNKAAPPATSVHRGDPFAVVIQRMRELNPNGFESRHPRNPKLCFNVESCMLLDMLAMNEVDRNFYILQSAFERNLLCIDETKEELVLNPDLYKNLWGSVNLFACEEHVQQILKVLSNVGKEAAGPNTSKPVAVVPAAPAALLTSTSVIKPAPAVPLSKTAAKKLIANAAGPAPQSKPIVISAAAQQTAPLSKNALKKKHRDSLVLDIILGKSGIAQNEPVTGTAAKSKNKKGDAGGVNINKVSSIERDLQDATKCMQSLMVEYKHTRPDCDVVSNHSSKNVSKKPKPQQEQQLQQQHKRGSRGGNGTAVVEQSAAAYRKTILFALQGIYQQVQDNNAELGQLSQPHEYEQFVRKFDRTVIAIQNRLHADPIESKTVTKPNPGKQLPSKMIQSSAELKTMNSAPPTFSNLVNNLALFVTSRHLYRCQPFYEPTEKSSIDQFDDFRNQALVDKFVDKLIADKLGKLVEGEIRINAYNLTQGYITSADTTEDTLVEGVLLRQCAMHSDLVRVFVFDHTEFTKDRANRLGFVVRLLERRNDRIILGHANLNKNRNYFLLSSTNKRVPALRIAKTPTYLSEISDQMLYMARLTSWQPDGQPLGEIVRTIGDRMALSTNNEAILLYNKLEVPNFSASIIDQLPSDTFEIPRVEYERRTDLTGDCIFTIDPATARDLDDALSVRQLPNGNHEVGVHISDVSYFIAENSELDRQIRQQTTSIYLVDNVYHMLPRSLCMTCSLLPGCDKLAFSVFWEMTDAGDVVATRFARTVIRSCVQLSYEHAQRMLDEPTGQWLSEELPQIHGNFSATQLADCVGRLHRLARPLRERRFQRNCLKIDQPKITFQLDEKTGTPITYERYRQIDSNWLIEEFMLLANETVAQTIFDAYPDCAILRNHMPPKQQGVELLATKLEQFGYRIDTSTPEAISVSLYKLLNSDAIGPVRMAVLCEWLTRPMNRALYVCSAPHTNKAHFALGIPIYTHFTSPIRRYPDILVHRLLAATLKLAEPPQLLPAELEKIAVRCNEQKYNAKCAGDASTELYFAHYVRHHEALELRAVVTEMISEDAFELMLLDTGTKLKIFVSVSVLTNWYFSASV